MLRRVLRGRVPRASDTGLRQARLGSREAYGARTGRERRSALSASDPASETAATLRAARPGIERLAKYSRFDRGRWRARTRLNELPVMGTARSRLGSACAATSEHAGRARCDAVRRHAPVEFAELRPRSLMSRKRPPGGNVVPSVRAPHRLPSGRPLAAEACRASGSLQKRSLLASSITPQTRSRRAHPAMLDGALRGASAGKPRRWWCKWFAKMSAARTRGVLAHHVNPADVFGVDPERRVDHEFDRAFDTLVPPRIPSLTTVVFLLTSRVLWMIAS